MLAQLADLRFCALMSFRSYVPAPLYHHALLSMPLCSRSALLCLLAVVIENEDGFQHYQQKTVATSALSSR